MKLIRYKNTIINLDNVSDIYLREMHNPDRHQITFWFGKDYSSTFSREDADYLWDYIIHNLGVTTVKDK